MPLIKEILNRARKHGAAAGEGTAAWYFDRTEPTREDYKLVLQGIRDVDPEILDTFHLPHPSTEEQQEIFDEIDASPRQIETFSNAILNAWEEGARDAYIDAVERYCLDGLERDVIFHLNVKLTTENEHELLTKLEAFLVEQGVEVNVAMFEEE